MSDSTSRLPPRPSLEQLRKQAKDRLASLRAADPAATLADAQYALARSYGFESWPRLVHHVEGVRASSPIEPFARLAEDTLAAYGGDVAAIERLIAHYGVSYDVTQLHVRIVSQVDDARGASEPAPSVADVQLMIARRYGFDDWSALAEGLAQPPNGTRDAPSAARLGLSGAPPFCRIDWAQRTIEPRPPLSDRDWDVVFGVMREHRLTGIVSPALTDGAMARLARLDFVTRVLLDGAQQLGDDGLLHLAAMPQLEHLDVSGWHSPITDRGLAVLRHLPRLRRFQMSWPQRVTDAGVAHLAACDALEDVNVMGTRTGDGLLAALAGKPALRRLHTGRLTTDAGLALLRHVPVFATWQGGEPETHLMSASAGPNALHLDGPFTRAGLASVAALEGLFGLSFFWHVSALRGDDMGAIRDLPHLGFLGCQDALCDDDAMRHIGAMPHLRMLMGQGAVATDEGFASLARSRTIERIWGRDCPNLGGRGFAALATMPALHGLAVSCRNVDDAALALLPTFPALRALTPMDVSDDGFRHVGACARLEELSCMYCHDTGDVATGHLANLTRLRTYYAGKTRITDASLDILAGIDALEKIELWQTAGVTDAGVASLAALPRLRELSISGVPHVTRRGVSVLPPRVQVTLDA
ncbi:MAG: hypothetical protein JO180_05115 [Gemmatirosa sp.]|nr:hypothetical protein [Gemmatirosa sp.]